MAKEKNEKNVATLNEHAHIAVQVLTEKEGNPSQSSLNEKTEQHFLKWAVSLRKDVASAVAGKYPDFASVVELIKTATEAQKKGKAIRDILADEFNAAYRFSREPGYMDDQDYCALVTALIFIIITVDVNAAKRPEVMSHANMLIDELESFESFDNKSTLYLVVCSEWLANYKDFRELFKEKLRESQNRDEPETSFEPENRWLPEQSKKNSQTVNIPMIDESSFRDTSVAPESSGAAQSGKPQRDDSQNYKPTHQADEEPERNVPSESTVSIDDLLERVDDVGKSYEATQLFVNSSADKVYELIRKFAQEMDAEIYALEDPQNESDKSVNFSVALRGAAGREYAKWIHFGHFYDSDQWVITIDVDEQNADTTLVNIKAIGQGNLLDRVKYKNAGLTLIEMSMYYAEKLIVRFGGSVKSTGKPRSAVQPTQPKRMTSGGSRSSRENRTESKPNQIQPIVTKAVLKRQFPSAETIVHQDIVSGESIVANELATWSIGLGGGAMDVIVVSHSKTPDELLKIISDSVNDIILTNTGEIGAIVDNKRHRIGEYRMIASTAHFFNAVICCFVGSNSYNLNNDDDCTLFNEAFRISADIRTTLNVEGVKAITFFADFDTSYSSNGFFSISFENKSPIAQQVYDSTFWENIRDTATVTVNPTAWFEDVHTTASKRKRR